MFSNIGIPGLILILVVLLPILIIFVIVIYLIRLLMKRQQLSQEHLKKLDSLEQQIKDLQKKL